MRQKIKLSEVLEQIHTLYNDLEAPKYLLSRSRLQEMSNYIRTRDLEEEVRLPGDDKEVASIAIAAYVSDQIDFKLKPDFRTESDGTCGDRYGYEAFEDGSLWYYNNAEDEVWADVSDFLIENDFANHHQNVQPITEDFPEYKLVSYCSGEEKAAELFSVETSYSPFE